MQGARDEAEAMMCKAVEDLLEATGTRAQDVGVLIVNCSLFCPTPCVAPLRYDPCPLPLLTVVHPLLTAVHPFLTAVHPLLTVVHPSSQWSTPSS